MGSIASCSAPGNHVGLGFQRVCERESMWRHMCKIQWFTRVGQFYERECVFPTLAKRHNG